MIDPLARGTTTTSIDAATAASVRHWLHEQGVGVREPLRFTVLPGGRSNLTYLLTDGRGGRWVLRRPPLSQVVRAAHDVLREHRIMAALQDTLVPVPRMVGRCPNDALIGAPFFVMEYVEGSVLSEPATLAPEAATRAGQSIVDLLVALHRVDPDAVGLGDLGARTGYVERQLRRWGQQLDRLESPHVARMARVLERLRATLPTEGPSVIVHGDFRPGNVIVGPDGSVRALLDWELCTLGDPLADVGWLLAYGFPERDVVLSRYADATGRDVSAVDFYIAFALWRLSVILAGVQTRLRHGAYGESAESHERMGERVATTVAASEQAIG